MKREVEARPKHEKALELGLSGEDLKGIQNYQRVIECYPDKLEKKFDGLLNLAK